MKVRAKPVTKKARIASDAAAFFDRSSLTYDTSESQFANYARLGLLADANQIGAKRDTILGFKPRVKGLPRRGAAGAERRRDDEARRRTRSRPRCRPRSRRCGACPTASAPCCASCSRATPTTSTRWRATAASTSTSTRRRTCAAASKLALDDADAAAAAADAGRAPPAADEPRATGLRKLTRDPNPAFSNRSMHFT